MDRSRREIVEEKWNARSHGLGLLLALVGFAALMAREYQGMLKAAIFVYSLSVIILFSASTLYHGCDDSKLKKKLRVFDHISIYYLIAGTYTPVCLSILENSKGVLLLYLVWGIAIFGTVLKLFFTGKFEAFSLILYGVMGWVIVIDLPFLTTHASYGQLLYLALGGAFYTVGILFYAVKKIPFNHLIWHFFVIFGAFFHLLLIASLE